MDLGSHIAATLDACVSKNTPAQCHACGKGAEYKCIRGCGSVYCGHKCALDAWNNGLHERVCHERLIGGKRKAGEDGDEQPGDQKRGRVEEEEDPLLERVLNILQHNDPFLEALVDVATMGQVRAWANSSWQFRAYIVNNARFWWLLLRRAGMIGPNERFNRAAAETYIQLGKDTIRARDMPNDVLHRVLGLVGRNEAAINTLFEVWGISLEDIGNLYFAHRFFRDAFANNSRFWYFIARRYNVIGPGPYDPRFPYREEVLRSGQVERPRNRYFLQLSVDGVRVDRYGWLRLNENGQNIRDTFRAYVNDFLWIDETTPIHYRYAVEEDDAEVVGTWYAADKLSEPIVGDSASFDVYTPLPPYPEDHPGVRDFVLMANLELRAGGPEIRVSVVFEADIAPAPPAQRPRQGEVVTVPWPLVHAKSALKQRMLAEFSDRYWTTVWVDAFQLLSSNEQLFPYYLSIRYERSDNNERLPAELMVPRNLEDVAESPYGQILRDVALNEDLWTEISATVTVRRR